MITVNVRSKNSEAETSTTKFNINKANWHPLTSYEARKKVTFLNGPQSAEALTENVYKKIDNSSKSAMPVIEIKKHFLKP